MGRAARKHAVLLVEIVVVFRQNVVVCVTQNPSPGYFARVYVPPAPCRASHGIGGIISNLPQSASATFEAHLAKIRDPRLPRAVEDNGHYPLRPAEAKTEWKGRRGLSKQKGAAVTRSAFRLGRIDRRSALGLLLGLELRALALVPPEHDRGGDEDRGVGARDNADEHREREVED